MDSMIEVIGVFLNVVLIGNGRASPAAQEARRAEKARWPRGLQIQGGWDARRLDQRSERYHHQLQ